MLRFRPLDAQTRFQCVAEALGLDAAAEARVLRIWDDASRQRNLTDDLVLRIVRESPECIEAAPVPYRYYFAQRTEPGLFPTPIRILAVSGVVSCEDHLIFGRRSGWLTQDSGLMELVPSGSVDAESVRTDGTVDVEGQFLTELGEELGCDQDVVRSVEIAGAIESETGYVVDVVIKAELDCTLEELIAGHSRLARPEYEELVPVARTEIGKAAARWGEDLSRVSRAILTDMYRNPSGGLSTSNQQR